MFIEYFLSRPSVISTSPFLPIQIFLVFDTGPSVSAKEPSSVNYLLGNLFQEPSDNTTQEVSANVKSQH